jgi:hAT family C-terminal dimerisation region
MTLIAFNILLIPTISAETERVFSDVKLTVLLNQNRLKENIIKITEYLN